jgi:hypothetical protein
MSDSTRKPRLWPLYTVVAITSCAATAGGVAIASVTVFALKDSNPISSLYREAPDTAPVSGWYGPGAWLSFVLSVCLAYWRTLQAPGEPVALEKGNEPKARSWDADLLVALVYVSVAVGDLIHQCALLMHSNPPVVTTKDLPPFAAAATVVHLTFGLTTALLVLPCLRAAYQARNLRNITPISAQHTVVWCIILGLDFTAMGVFEYTLSRHHSFDNKKDNLIDVVFSNQSVIFNTRFSHLSALPPDWIQKHFGPWKYVAIVPTPLFVVFFTGRALFIMTNGPSTNATEDDRHRARDSCIALMDPAPVLFVFFGGLIMVSLGWLWLAVWGMFVPGSVFKPESGIGIAELDQIGALVTVLLVQMLRAFSSMHQRLKGRRIKSAARAIDEENALTRTE